MSTASEIMKVERWELATSGLVDGPQYVVRANFGSCVEDSQLAVSRGRGFDSWLAGKAWAQAMEEIRAEGIFCQAVVPGLADRVYSEKAGGA